ncbi:MAG: hypothetical protein NTY37_08040 [Methanothrix sp.]|nr:hypothetical protein [Methanothrix sp.]
MPGWPAASRSGQRPWPWQGAAGRARRLRAESCTGQAGTVKSAGIVMARTVAGFVAGGW